MKKFTIILSALLFCFVTAWSQKIKYENSFEEAKIVSLEQNKPLSILITIEPPAHVTNFIAGLNDQKVVNKFNQNFVNYKVDRADSASGKIIKQYQVTSFPSFIFLDSKGGLMFNDFGALPVPRLLSMIDQALYANKEKSLVDFDKEYNAGVYNTTFLKDYINRRIKVGITDNANLIEKYVDSLSIADLDNYNQVLFIMKAGPLADGKAYKLAHTNRKIIDSIFKHELFDVRVAINNRITANTMANAIATKNMARANAAASFTRTSWGRDNLQGQKSYTLKMLQYYSATKDTTNYLRQTAFFYDQYYMNISADSIRRMDQKNMEKAKSNSYEQATMNIPEGGAIKSFSYIYAANNFSTELNNGAYSVYQTGTKNTSYLTKAILWSKRSIELNPVAGYYDTLSHLLYRLGFYSEAESTQQKAVELAKAEKRNVKQMQEEFMKIKNKSL